MDLLPLGVLAGGRAVSKALSWQERNGYGAWCPARAGAVPSHLALPLPLLGLLSSAEAEEATRSCGQFWGSLCSLTGTVVVGRGVIQRAAKKKKKKKEVSDPFGLPPLVS